MTTKNSAAAIAAVCVVALSVAVSGATQDIPQVQRDGAAGSAPTLSGCLARGTGTGTYTLTTGARKDAPPPKAGEQPLTVALTGTEVDLAPHVGHTVSLTGSYAAVIGPAGTAVGTTGTAKPAPDAAAVTAEKELRSFTVKTLKMVTASCTDAAD